MNHVSLTEKCADYILSTKYENIPEDVIDMAKRCIIDLFGCVIGASKTPEAEIILSLIREEGAKQKSSILGVWDKTSVLNAVLANGYIGHIFEMDDMYTGASMHPGLPVIPVAVALSEYLNKNGKELLEAIVIGYEIVMRVSECVFPSHYEHWHTTGTCGTFGAAATAGKLLGLNREQLVWAFGNAGSQASGLWQFSDDGAMTKYLHCGKAAYNGLLSALLAEKGYTGARRILEGARGFVAAASRETNPEKAFEGLGNNTYRIMRTAFKPYPSCGHTHTAISAALAIYKKHEISTEQIKQVFVKVNAMALRIACKNDLVTTTMEAKFSLKYCVAAALYYGVVDNNTINAANITKQDFTDFTNKIIINVDSKLTENYPYLQTAIVHVCMVDGNEYVETVDYPKGSANDPLSKDELFQKYLAQSSSVVSQDSAKKLLNRCNQIENIIDIRSIFVGL